LYLCGTATSQEGYDECYRAGPDDDEQPLPRIEEVIGEAALLAASDDGRGRGGGVVILTQAVETKAESDCADELKNN
jgi:hypothetical protein